MQGGKRSNNTSNRNLVIGAIGLITFGVGFYAWNNWVNKKKPRHLLLCGAPASGKGTQCEKLVDKYGYVHLSTGDILREAVKEGTVIGQQAKGYMDRGDLVPDHIVIGVVDEKMKSDETKKKGWILDGFPRTEEQAKALSAKGNNPDKIFVFDVPEKELYERVTGRRTDPVTGKIYHLKNRPPETEEIRARLVHRSDDHPDKLKNRLKGYNENIDFILKHYQGKTPIIRINAEKPPDVVFKEIEKELH